MWPRYCGKLTGLKLVVVEATHAEQLAAELKKNGSWFDSEERNERCDLKLAGPSGKDAFSM